MVLMICAGLAYPVYAEVKSEEPIPRILLVGDSWPMFLSTGLFFWTYENGSAFRDILPGLGYGRWCDRGYTAIGGTMITQWSSNELTVTPYGVLGKLDFIRAELTEYPTLDIVHLCLGGNDYMRGDFSNYIDYIPYQMQTLQFVGAPTGGTFTLTFQGQTTAPIPYNVDASVVQSALENLSTIGQGNITVLNTTGTPRYFCWFQGIFASTPVPMMTANGSGLTGDGDEQILVNGVKFDHGWKDTWGSESPAELAFANAVLEQLQIIVEYVLAVRPDVRVLVCDYDYMDEAAGGAAVREANMALANGGHIKLELVHRVTAKPQYANRCFFLNTYGLMQWWFGYPCDFQLVSQAPNEERIPVYPPEGQLYGPQGAPGTMGVIQLPGTYPDYVPWTGGNINYPGPRMAILYDFGKDAPQWLKDEKGGNIHLHKEGNHVYAWYCVQQFYGAWLDLPKVLSVNRTTYNPMFQSQVYDPTGLDQVTFEVTFSQPVSGVDESDFAPAMHGGVANASIASVAEGKDGTTYTVVVNTGEGDGELGLTVNDDDSIAGGGGPLGGVGPGNGYFAYGANYTIQRSAGLPVAGWPAAVMLLAAGIRALRRRTK
jgi:hypothetical protein